MRRAKRPVQAIAPNTMYLSPAAASVDVGNNVVIQLRIKPQSAGVDGVQANVDYNPALLSVASISTSGSAFPTDLLQTQTSGRVRIERGILGSTVAPDGLIVTITFNALAGGTATISLSDANATLAGSYTNPTVQSSVVAITGTTPSVSMLLDFVSNTASTPAATTNSLAIAPLGAAGATQSTAMTLIDMNGASTSISYVCHATNGAAVAPFTNSGGSGPAVAVASNSTGVPTTYDSTLYNMPVLEAALYATSNIVIHHVFSGFTANKTVTVSWVASRNTTETRTTSMSVGGTSLSTINTSLDPPSQPATFTATANSSGVLVIDQSASSGSYHYVAGFKLTY